VQEGIARAAAVNGQACDGETEARDEDKIGRLSIHGTGDCSIGLTAEDFIGSRTSQSLTMIWSPAARYSNPEQPEKPTTA